MTRFTRNLSAVLIWELLWGFGAACTSSSIFVPFLSQLSGSKLLVGTVGLTTLLGVPALFVSLSLAHRLRRMRLAVALLSALQVVGWAVLGAVLVSGSTVAIPIIFVTQTAVAFIGAVSMAPTYQLLTSGFGDRFGTAQGLQLLVRQISGVAGGLWAASALAKEDFPHNFGRTFLIGGMLLTISNAALLFFAEEVKERPRRETISMGQTLRAARTRSSIFVVAAFAATITSAESMFVVSALERLHLGDRYAGIFASVNIAMQGIGGAIAGRTGDRFGHAKVLVFSFSAQIVSLLSIAVLVNLTQFYAALALAGLANAAMQIGLAGLTARLAPEGEQGSFMAMMRWVIQIVSAAAIAAIALLTDRAGYTVLFIACSVPMFAALPLARRLGSYERK